MYRSIPVPDGGVWVDLGGGTGANLEPIGDELHLAGKVYLVDLCDSLLAVARKRCDARGWKNVEAVHADATLFRPAEGQADVVTFSYSLTMIPDWFAAIDNALAMLRPGGTIGVTDFFVARKYAADGRGRHSWFTRTFWPAWFGSDNVFLSADHVPYLQRRFETVRLDEYRAKVPYSCHSSAYRTTHLWDEKLSRAQRSVRYSLDATLCLGSIALSWANWACRCRL